MSVNTNKAFEANSKRVEWALNHRALIDGLMSGEMVAVPMDWYPEVAARLKRGGLTLIPATRPQQTLHSSAPEKDPT